MSINKSTFLSGLTLFLVLGSSALQAADERFCERYARKSVQQQVANVAYECNNTGLRWSPLYEGQKAWCLTVRQSIAENETKEREAALTSCGVTSAPIQWQGLKGAPSVWDALFAQEMQAMRKDDVASIKIMHQHGVNIKHDEGGNNGTILYHAIANQAEKSARYLVQQGVNPNQTTNGGWNPLINMFTRYDKEQRKYVDTKANLSLLQFLLNHGADPNSFGELGPGDLPLDKAATQGDMRATTLLLSTGANPNLFDQAQGPLLTRMIERRNTNIITLLVNWGADVNGHAFASCEKPVRDVKLPLDKAHEMSLNAVARLLRSRGAKTMAECLAAAG